MVLNNFFCREAKAWREPGESMFYCVFFPNSPEKVRSCVQKEGIQIQKSRDKRYRDVVMNISAVVEGTPFVKGTQETTFGGGFAIVDSPTEVSMLYQKGLHEDVVFSFSRIACCL
jgi:hypothetical protein